MKRFQKIRNTKCIKIIKYKLDIKLKISRRPTIKLNFPETLSPVYTPVYIFNSNKLIK